MWWSITESSNSLHAIYYSIASCTIVGTEEYENYVNKAAWFKSSGMYVRCIKD